MKTQHWLDHLTKAASNHIALAKSCKAMAGHHAAMSECAKASKSDMGDGKDAATVHAEMSNEYAAMSETHADDAENCMELCKALKTTDSRKAMGGHDPDEIMPNLISLVAPDAPAHKLVPRYGAPPLQKAAEVDEKFRSLVSIDDERDG